MRKTSFLRPTVIMLALVLAQSVTASDEVAAPPPLHYSTEELEHILGWVNDPNPDSICQGFYAEKPILMPSDTTLQDTNITSDHAILFQHKPSELQGNVVVTQPGRKMTADKAIGIPEPDGSKTKFLNLYGHVFMHELGMLSEGTMAHIDLPEKSAILHNAVFRYQIPAGPKKYVYNTEHQIETIQIDGVNYRGTAQTIHRINPHLTELTNATMTTCVPGSDAWYLNAKTVYLNQETQVGTAYDATLSTHNIPFLYTPYFRFPIGNTRKSGFLYPTLQSSTLTGIGLGIPYYWNMAPNYDMTITPTYFWDSKFQFNDLFRYLTPTSNGQMFFSMLPDDTAFNALQQQASTYTTAPKEANQLEQSSDTRYEFAWINTSQFNPLWSANVNFDYVSDSYYINDFGLPPFSNAASALLPTTLLAQTANLDYAGQHWSFVGALENYQTLHTVYLPGLGDQYARLPELDSNGTYPDNFLGLDYNFSSEFTDFQFPLLEPNFTPNLPGVTGLRFNATPSIDDNLENSWGTLEPQIILNGTAYDLQNPVQNTVTDQSNSMSRVLPTYDINGAMYFDRDLDIGGTPYTQVLEPQLFYLYTPYLNQNNFPVFDGALNPALTFQQLFQTNRFSGYDFIGDANQLTVAATTRFINNETGVDVLDISVGQIEYFENRLVQIPGTAPPFPTYNTDPNSPIVGQINWQAAANWTATGNVAYAQDEGYLQSASGTVTYTVDNNHILNATYSFVQQGNPQPNAPPGSDLNDLNQIGVGTSWQLFNPHWDFLGSINYNISQTYSQTYFAGLQYNNCCFSIRALDARSYIGFQPNGTTPYYDNTVYVQFLFTGLSGVGNSPASLLTTAIPGYVDPFQASSVV